jgi:alpha-methylacyl-CoA racemase
MGRPSQGPSHPGVLLGDVGGGTFGAVTGILAAVIHRHATGEGQRIDISMADGALWLNAMAANGVLAGGPDPRAGEHALAGGSAYDYYRTLDGGHLAVGALEPKFWSMFCHAIGRPDLEHHDASDAASMTELKYAIAHTIAQRDLVDWQGVFAEVPCCVEPVLSTRDALAHPQFQARGMVVDVPLPGGGHVRQVANPVRLEACPARYDHASVTPGTHTEEVLGACGFDAGDIARLRTGRAIA